MCLLMNKMDMIVNESIKKVLNEVDIGHNIPHLRFRQARCKWKSARTTTELAKNAIDYDVPPDYRTHYKRQEDNPVELVDCSYFTTNLYELTKPLDLSLAELDSFVVLICIEGVGMAIGNNGVSISLKSGETLLVLVSVAQLQIVLKKTWNTMKLLICYIKYEVNNSSQVLKISHHKF